MAEPVTPMFTEAFVSAQQTQNLAEGGWVPQVSAEDPEFAERDFVDLFTMGAPLVLADAINTTASSLTFGLIDPDLLEQQLKQHLPEAARFYHFNKQGVRFASSIPTTVLPGMLGIKAINATNMAAKAVRGVPVLGRVLHDVDRHNRLLRAVHNQNMRLARRGHLGDTYKTDTVRQRLVNELRISTTLKGTKEAIAAEASIYLFQNENNMIYPEEFEWYDYLPFIAGGALAGIALEGVMLRKKMRAFLAESASAGHKALNPENLPTSFIISRPGSRDLSLTTNAVHRAALEGAKRQGRKARPTLSNNLDKEIVQTERSMRDVLKAFGKEVEPGGISPAFVLREDQLDTVIRSLREHPANFLGVKNISQYENPAVHRQRVEALNKRIRGIEKEARDLRKNELSIQAAKKVEEANELKSWQPMIFRGGEWVPLEDDFVRVQDGLKSPFVWARENKLTGLTHRGYGNLFDPTSGTKVEVEIDENFNLHLPGAGDELEEGFLKLTPFERSAVYDLYGRLIDGTAELGAKDVRIQIDPTDHFTKIDAVDLAIQRGRLKEENVRFSDPHMTMEEARTLSLQKKFTSFNKLKDSMREGDFADVKLRSGEVLPGNVVSAFVRLGNAQRGTPETAMLRVQRAYGGGVYNVLVEHVGDLTHRMSHMARWGEAGREFVKEKTERALRHLRKNVEREFVESANNNARAVFEDHGIPRNQYDRELNEQINRYIAAHRKLPVYNRVQFLAREAAIAVGERKWNTARKHIEELDVLAKDEETWSKAAFDYRIENGKILQYPFQGRGHKISADFGFGLGTTITQTQIRHALNLPGGQYGQLSPLEEFFESMRLQGNDTLEGFDFSDIKDLASRGEVVHEGLEFANPNLDTFGRSFDRDAPGFFAFRKDMEPQGLTRQFLNEELLTRHMDVRNKLSSAPYVGRLAAKIVGTPGDPNSAYNNAIQVDMIHQGGMAGQSILVQGRHAARDVGPIVAGHDLQTIAEKDARLFQEKLFEPHLTTFAELRKRDNFAAMTMFGEYLNARSAGWELLPEARPMNGKWAFVLDHKSPANQRRFKARFGTELGEGTLMPITRVGNEYVPLEVPNLVLRAAEAFRDIGLQLRDEQNAVFSAMGLGGLRRREWWAPPKNFGNQNVAYLVQTSEEGDVIKMMFRSPSRKELEEFVNSGRINEFLPEGADVGSPGSTYVLRTEDQVEQYFLSRDRAFFELVDVSDHLVRRGKVHTGSSASPLPENPRTLLDEAVSSINNQVNLITRDTMGLLFEGQIAYAQRAHRAQLTLPQFGSGAQRSVWEAYQDAILGNRALRRSSNLHNFYNTIENTYDNIMLALWEKHVGQAVKGGLRSVLKSTTGIDLDGKEFAKLKNELGDFLPFATTEQFVRSNFGVRPPRTMQKDMAALNRLTSGLILRWFEVAHPLLNLSGVISTMPAVTKALRKRPNETKQQWQQRISAYGTVIENEQPLAHLNPVRLMASAVHHGFTAEGRAFLDDAVARGLIRQEVSEIQRTLNDPFVTGGFETIRNKVDKWVGFLSDRSEEWARAWAHLGGDLLAQQHGIKNIENRQIFAHRFANEIIGDYRAVNRPQVFQGAVGMPLGLFQTWTWNYYQRLFSYIENADWRAAATQLAMQASVFGAVTVPGYAAFNKMFTMAQDGVKTPVDAIQSAYGPNAADFILYGTISNIPKIFGGDGVALYSRGDVSPRVPAFLDPSQAPIVNLANDTATAVSRAIGSMLPGGQGLTLQKSLELIGAYSASRPLKGVAELAAGYSIDQRGNVIEDDVRNAMSIVSRVIGLRPIAEAKSREALFRLKVSDASRYAKRTRMREDLKAAMRGGNLDGAAVRDAFITYIQTTGNPEDFPAFISQLMLNARTPRIAQQLEENLKSRDLEDVFRLLNAMTPADE